MAKIIAPNNQYNGLSASVMFANGVGETDDPNLLAWFEEKGYTIEVTEPAVDEEAERKKAEAAAKKEAEKQLKALRKKATELGIEEADKKDFETLTAEIETIQQPPVE